MYELNTIYKSVPTEPVSELAPVASGQSLLQNINSNICPVCGHADAKTWLQAPDRLHGRQMQYTLMRCSACSLVWLRDPPEPAEMHWHYTEAYNRLISASGEKSFQRWQLRSATLNHYKKAGTLLDMGCSSGAFLHSISNKKWCLFGIEMSEESAKQAQARSGAQVFVGNILDAPYPHSSFDAITCFDVFEHLYDPNRAIEKVVEWLKPGGIFYILVPNVESAEARFFGSYWQGLELPRHLFHYSPTSLKYLAESSGLRNMILETHRNQSVGTSLRYAVDDVLRAVGIHRTPVVYQREASIPWRAVRKTVRMTVLRVLLEMAPLVGGGESLHAVFKKDASHDKGRQYDRVG
jgi:SAM-dependent methyltransferase